MRWARHVAYVRNAYKILAGKLYGKRTLGKPGRRWEDNIRTIKELRALVNMIMNLQVPQKVGKFLSS
jgi:hypothetical protein